MQDLNTIPSVGTFGEVARNANTNFSLLKIAVDLLEHSIEHSRGYFTSASALTTAFPSPAVGDWAIVEVSGSPVIYKCSTAGTWSNSGTAWAGGSVALTEYLKKGTGDEEARPMSANWITSGAAYELKTDILGRSINYVDGRFILSTGSLSGTGQPYGYGLNSEGGSYFPCAAGDTVKWHTGGTYSGIYLCFYDSNKEFLKYINAPSPPRTYTAPANTAFVRFSYVTAQRSAAYLAINGVTVWKAQEAKAGMFGDLLKKVQQTLSNSEKAQVLQNLGLIIENQVRKYSDALVTSGAVNSAIENVTGRAINYTEGRYLLSTNSSSVSGADEEWGYGNGYIPVQQGDVITWAPEGTMSTACLVVYNSNKEKIAYKAASATSAGTPLVYTVAASTAAYIRASFFLANRANAYVMVNGVVVWQPLDAIAGQIPKVVDNLTSSLTDAALSANQGQLLSTDRRLEVVGADTTLVSKSWRGMVMAGHVYRLWILSFPFDISGDTATTNRTRLLIRYKRDADAEWSEAVKIMSNTELKEYYDFRIGGSGSRDIRFNIALRATADVKVKFLLEDITNAETVAVEENIYRSIYETNSDKDIFPKMIAAKMKHRDAPSARVPVMFAHISDVHGTTASSAYRTRYSRFISFATHWKDKGYIDDMLDSGDMTYDNFNYGLPWREGLAGVESILTVLGNHDTAEAYGSGDDWRKHSCISIDPEKRTDAYNRFMIGPDASNPYISNWGVVQPSNAAANGWCYYYKDYASRKLRLIALDVMGYDETQDSWLQDILSDAITRGYHVAILAHFCGSAISPITCNYNSLFTTSGDMDGTITYNNYVPHIAQSVNAFQLAGGIFACYITGHFHRDMVYRVTDYPDQLVFAVDSGGKPSDIRDFTKVSGSKTYDSFQIVSIDTYSKLVKLIKIGCDVDFYMRKKSTLCVSYETHAVKGEGY